MKYCVHCGKELADDFRFCNGCGAPVTESGAPAPEAPTAPVYNEERLIAEEKQCLDTFHRFLKYERIAWKVEAIVFLVLAALFAFLGFVFLLGSADAYSTEADALIALGITYLFMGVFYVPISIVGFTMAKKAKYYMDTLYTDAGPMASRCGSAGMIVLGALFNTIAMIFIIVNFTRTKSNAAILRRAIDRQRNFRG